MSSATVPYHASSAAIISILASPFYHLPWLFLSNYSAELCMLVVCLQVDAEVPWWLARHPCPEPVHHRLLPGEWHWIWHQLQCDAVHQGRADLPSVPKVLPVLMGVMSLCL